MFGKCWDCFYMGCRWRELPQHTISSTIWGQFRSRWVIYMGKHWEWPVQWMLSVTSVVTISTQWGRQRSIRVKCLYCTEGSLVNVKTMNLYSICARKKALSYSTKSCTDVLETSWGRASSFLQEVRSGTYEEDFLPPDITWMPVHFSWVWKIPSIIEPDILQSSSFPSFQKQSFREPCVDGALNNYPHHHQSADWQKEWGGNFPAGGILWYLACDAVNISMAARMLSK